MGLKILIPGFFWVAKFGKYFFRWLDLSRDFLGYSKQSEDWRVVLRIKYNQTCSCLGGLV